MIKNKQTETKKRKEKSPSKLNEKMQKQKKFPRKMKTTSLLIRELMFKN